MDPKLEEFKERYPKWVEESLAEFQAGQSKKYLEKYPFMIYEHVPWVPFSGKAADKKFALITTGGIYLRSRQIPFETESIHGDPSFREIPKTVRPEELAIAHGHYDQSLAEKDLNCVFPIDRFIELEKEGIIGGLAEVHYSFTYVNDIIPLMEKSIPEVIRRIRAEAVSALFLVPV